MSGDDHADHGADGKRGSQRRLKQPTLPPGPLRALKDWLYWLYQRAGNPSLDEMHRQCERDGTDQVAGWPSRDTIHRIISARTVPPSQLDTVAVARTLARLARQDPGDAAVRARELWLQAQTFVPLGTPLDQVRDPFALHVHRPITLDRAVDLPPLPPYVRRAHDDLLDAVIAQARCGQSAMAVLVAGSSAGKTRALWEALEPLRQAGGWRLWHPFDPTRPQAAVARLDQVGPRTVVWLNETQEYLDAPGDIAEQVAAKLHSLLIDSTRAPVLVLGTLWPGHHAGLTRRSGSQVTQLLDGTVIQVPETFRGADLDTMARTAKADARLAAAVKQAEGGHITQYLAGAPELLARFDAAPPAARAVIEAAMDARRMGHRNALPHALLEAAAPAYLTDLQWDQLADNWLEDALAYTGEPCKGARGPVTRIRSAHPRSARRTPGSSSSADGAVSAGGPVYRLADYLDQHGRATRADQIPPIGFWTAAAAHAHPTDQVTLGHAAWQRLLYRDAAQLHKNATDHGSPSAARALIGELHAVHPTDHRPAAHVAAHVAVDDPAELTGLLNDLRHIGAGEQVTALAERVVAHASLDDPAAVGALLEQLERVGAGEQVAALVARDIAAHVAVDDPYAVLRLLIMLRRIGSDEQVIALADRAAAQAPLHVPGDVAALLGELHEIELQIGAGGQVAALVARDIAAHVAVDDPYPVVLLLTRLREVGAYEQAGALADRAAARTSLDEPAAIACLMGELRKVEVDQQTAVLAERAAAHTPLHKLHNFPVLLKQLRKVGAVEQVTALADRAAAHAPLHDPGSLAFLLKGLWEVGAVEQVTALADRAAAHAPLHDPGSLAFLLEGLREVGMAEQVTALVGRDIAVHVALDEPYGVARLLDEVHEIGAVEQVTALADRAAAHAPLQDPAAVAALQAALRRAGADRQVTALARRAAVAHRLSRLRHRARARRQMTALMASEPAARAPLDNLDVIAALLERLRKVGADEQVTALADRAAADTPLQDPSAVAILLERLRKVGADEQVTALADRLPAVGMLGPFLKVGDHKSRYRFGRKPDGRPADPWGWGELE
ncbi:hypothetical protein [Actinomadura gamaensis]|uniref:ATP-binding protein n=1 Tax=Actinomadura gamaensis TaxID=1763541 RepID=A0ABV9TTJ3_9ACTN